MIFLWIPWVAVAWLACWLPRWLAGWVAAWLGGCVAPSQHHEKHKLMYSKQPVKAPIVPAGKC